MPGKHGLFLGIAVAALAFFAGVLSARYPASPDDALPTLASGAIERLFESRFDDLSGNSLQISQWKGKTLVINFWATWCPPCRKEMPAFSRLQDKHAANGVQFVGISIDSMENVRAFSNTNRISYPLLNGELRGEDLARQLGNPRLALPYTLILAPSGTLRFARAGAISEAELEALLLAALRP
jgi:thiol-disulfide isomerase/thioredoxin